MNIVLSTLTKVYFRVDTDSVDIGKYVKENDDINRI